PIYRTPAFPQPDYRGWAGGEPSPPPPQTLPRKDFANLANPPARHPGGTAVGNARNRPSGGKAGNREVGPGPRSSDRSPRSEEHTSELQSLRHLVCRLLLEKKKKQ